MPLSHQGWPNSEYHETFAVFRALELVQPFWKLSSSTSFSQRLLGRSYPPALPHPPSLTSTLPPRIPANHICIENQWENLIEDLANWTFDAGKPEFLKRKHCVQKCKAATASSTGFPELTHHVPVFELQYIHVLYPAPTHSTRSPLLLPPTGKQALQTKLKQLCGSPSGRTMLFPVEKQRYHIMELSAWDAVLVS